MYLSDEKLYTNENLNKGLSYVLSTLNKDNLEYFEKEGFTPIMPRIGTFEERLDLCKTKWVAFSLQEFLDICEKDLASKQEHMYILVDILNYNKLFNLILLISFIFLIY